MLLDRREDLAKGPRDESGAPKNDSDEDKGRNHSDSFLMLRAHANLDHQSAKSRYIYAK